MKRKLEQFKIDHEYIKNCKRKFNDSDTNKLVKNIITNREELKAHIHSIHDYLRNRGLGVSMTALKIFNLFYALKIIDGKHHTFNPPLDEVCSWEKIRKSTNVYWFF